MAKKQCDEALEKLYEYIDHELPDDELLRIGEHLKDCSPCDSELRINEKIKNLASQCGGECAPTDLREKILMTIQQEREEV